MIEWHQHETFSATRRSSIFNVTLRTVKNDTDSVWSDGDRYMQIQLTKYERQLRLLSQLKIILSLNARFSRH